MAKKEEKNKENISKKTEDKTSDLKKDDSLKKEKDLSKKEEISQKKKVIYLKKRGKKYKEAVKLIDKNHLYGPEEAIDLACKTSITSFDSSIEAHINLNIKAEQTDQNIRTIVDLPEGTGKKLKIAAIVNPSKEEEAKKASADFVGSDDLISKIEKGFLDFDIVIATPDMMGKIGKLGKILGTKGLMPNPKTETITENPGKTISRIKKGVVELKNDSSGIVHCSFGKVSFGKEKLLNNLKAIIEAIFRAKHSSVKGHFIKSVSISTTMGPSIKIDIDKLNKLIQDKTK